MTPASGTKRGEAGRALSAAFLASLLGGLFGAMLLAASVAVLRPLMLLIGSPELLALCVFGLSLVANLSGRVPMKGLCAAAFGVLLSTVGDEPQEGQLRWTFDLIYLWEGVPLVPLALGLFALPELAELAVTRRRMVQIAARDAIGGYLQGVRDVLRNWWLVLRCSWLGSALGAIPGMGASVIDWIAYGHALRTEKGARDSFGKGDIRGVIAPEASNNAKDGGALMPTIAFGVPGSASMAILMGAFLMKGITPGPDMLTGQLDITFTLIWALVLANIVGAGICFLLAPRLVAIAAVPFGVLVPVTLTFVLIGAWQANGQWGDLIVLLAAGIVGWIMKLQGWPRSPLVLGFILGALVERYMFISIERFGMAWLLNPIVLVLFGLTAVTLLRALLALRQPRVAGQRRRFVLDAEVLSLLLLGALFAAALVVARDWPFAARLVPQVVAVVGLVAVVLQLWRSLWRVPAASDAMLDLPGDLASVGPSLVRWRGLAFFGWLAGTYVLTAIGGLVLGIGALLVLYMVVEGRMRWPRAALAAMAVAAAVGIVFTRLVPSNWPDHLLQGVLPLP